MKLLDIIAEDAILPELEATDRDGVLREMVRALTNARRVPARHAEELVRSLLEREKQFTTGIGKGVATPHTRHDAVPALAAALARSARGVEYGSLDNQPVQLFIMVLCPAGRNDLYLPAMETIFGHLKHDEFLTALKHANTREGLLALLRSADGGAATAPSAAAPSVAAPSAVAAGSAPAASAPAAPVKAALAVPAPSAPSR